MPPAYVVISLISCNSGTGVMFLMWKLTTDVGCDCIRFRKVHVETERCGKRRGVERVFICMGGLGGSKNHNGGLGLRADGLGWVEKSDPRPSLIHTPVQFVNTRRSVNRHSAYNTEWWWRWWRDTILNNRTTTFVPPSDQSSTSSTLRLRRFLV